VVQKRNENALIRYADSWQIGMENTEILNAGQVQSESRGIATALHPGGIH